MIGNIRWNLWLGIVGFVVPFLFSVANNLFMTTVIRSLYGFAILFMVAFAIRWLLGTAAGLKQVEIDRAEEPDQAGRTVDIVTPEENDLQDVIRQNIGASPARDTGPDEPFAPLAPPKLVSNLREESGADLANAVRRLKDE